MVNLLASAGEHLFGRLWSQAEQDQEQYDDPVEWDDFAEWDDPVEEFEAETWEPTPRTEPSPTRWAITFTVIAVLIVIFSAIVFFGFIQADWLYGTYSEISEAQWEQIANLRDELAQLGIAPEAVVALDDALLLPRPSTQDVLRDLKTAARALDQHSRIAAARRVQDRLYALIGAIESPSIEPGYERPTAIPWATPTPTPGPTSTPILDAPVAQNNHNSVLGPLPMRPTTARSLYVVDIVAQRKQARNHVRRQGGRGQDHDLGHHGPPLRPGWHKDPHHLQ